MDFQPAASAPHRSRDDAAMPNGHRSLPDHPRTRPDKHDLGMTTSRRSISPAAAAVNRSPHIARERGRERERDATHNHHSQRHHHRDGPRQRSPEPSRLASQHRRRSRRRSPDHVTHSSRTSTSHRPSRANRENSRDPPARRREPDRSPDRRRFEPGSLKPPSRALGHPDRGRQRGASRSPPPSKRPCSPDKAAPGRPQAKSSRQGGSPPRAENLVQRASRPTENRRGGSPPNRWPHSPDSYNRRSRHKNRTGRSRSASPSRRDRPRSPGTIAAGLRQRNASRQRSASSRRRERSPLPNYRRRPRSSSRTPPPLRGARPPTSSDTGLGRRASPDSSARDLRHPRSDQNGRSRISDIASGANSVDVNMTARGGMRGGFNPQQSNYSAKGPFGPGYAQSSGHGTPNSSYHGSPPAQSPLGGSGRGWNGQQPLAQFSPQRQAYLLTALYSCVSSVLLLTSSAVNFHLRMGTSDLLLALKPTSTPIKEISTRTRHIPPPTRQTGPRHNTPTGPTVALTGADLVAFEALSSGSAEGAEVASKTRIGALTRKAAASILTPAAPHLQRILQLLQGRRMLRWVETMSHLDQSISCRPRISPNQSNARMTKRYP